MSNRIETGSEKAKWIIPLIITVCIATTGFTWALRAEIANAQENAIEENIAKRVDSHEDFLRQLNEKSHSLEMRIEQAVIEQSTLIRTMQDAIAEIKLNVTKLVERE